VSSDDRNSNQEQIPLPPGATVVVIGGGPAGAFFAIQLLQQAAKLKRPIKLLVFERRLQTADAGSGTLPECWRGCNHCAGGISPRLNDSLRDLGLSLPEGVIQSRIRSLTIQGYWKNITLEVPAGREMYSVYRGSRPSRRLNPQQNLDGFLLQAAQQAGAEVIGAEATGVARLASGKPVVTYRRDQAEAQVEADLLVFATGVNGKPGMRAEDNPMVRAIRQVLPSFQPPRLRRALIFEMELDAAQPPWLDAEVHFVEYGSKGLPLEMCSLVPKRGFLTAVLVGRSVDRAVAPDAARRIMRQFLELPHIRKLVPPRTQLRLACTCSPNMVVGSARHPFGSRVAVVGDMVTARLYKDGLLSAQRTAAALAAAVLERGVDEESLRRGYGPVVEQFRRDNRYAAVVFLIHRVVFSSSVLSRFLYQAVITERKTTPASQRMLENILWKIASGDDRYEQAFRAMVRPLVLWSILSGGIVVTLRNYVAELLFGLRWSGLGRFTTGVALERLEAKRAAFAHWLAEFHLPVPSQFEFERMYTIRIRSPRAKVFTALGRFGEPDREYLQPRWVRIQRVAGAPNTCGCTIEYRVVLPRFAFRLTLEHVVENQLAVYRVQNGFARGGVLIFELETRDSAACDLSIYVAFNFPRGRNLFTGPVWWLMRHGFPAFVHDVIWNHSLCQLKDSVEARHQSDGILFQEQDVPASSALRIS
jgi:2-polyprenyl-6-methoxyphenol hydroxylase-like FAD-dependent oxidoreductase